jgi:hypothetical protein
MEERQSDRLQVKAPSLQTVSPIIVRKDSPTSDPENSPKDHLQNRYILRFVKNQLISTDPDSPTKGCHSNHNKVPSLLRKTSKPRTKKVLHTSGSVNSKSNGNTTPNKPSQRAVEKEVLDCFVLRTKATLRTPLPPSLY